MSAYKTEIVKVPSELMLFLKASLNISIISCSIDSLLFTVDVKPDKPEL